MKHKIKINRFRSVKISVMLAILVLSIKSNVSGQEKKVEQWSYSMGIGMAVVPSYLGDNNYQTVMFPNFTATYSDKFSASLFEGLRYKAFQFDAWSIGALMRFNIGRFEDGTLPGRVVGKNTSDLIGLGDIDFSVEPGVYVQYTHGSIVSNFNLRKGIGGHNGLIAEFSAQFVEKFQAFGKSIQYGAGPMMRMTNSEYNDTFFGVNQTQSQESNIAVYRPTSSALSIGFTGSILIPMSTRVSTSLYFNYNRLGDPIAKSNLLRSSGSRHQAVTGITFNYSL
ncbi:MipA/OmpV family protein [Roseivirga sp.]|uniref:MipA/OmpV family protein n=1 Tax=Roseivirga sp. TaxID=1964215 RepID=UPI003B8BE6DE